jgi:3-dehydroquinate dehydratase-1
MRLGDLELGRCPVVVGVLTDPDNKKALRDALKIGIDALEFRIDHFKYVDIDRLLDFAQYVHRKGPRIIVTVRSIDEGGKYLIADSKRLEIFSALTPVVDAVDVELSSRAILKDVVKVAKRFRKKVIVSYHNFHATPLKGRLNLLIKKGKTEGGDIVKISTKTKDYADLKRLARITLEHKNIITIAMGERGVSSRIFFPLLGSLLTYSPISDTTAPGQLPLKTVREEINRYSF